MFPLSLTVCELFAQIIKSKSFDLENEGKSQLEERGLRHSTETVRIHGDDFFKEFQLPGNIGL